MEWFLELLFCRLEGDMIALLMIATISVLLAILEVKKMTVIKINIDINVSMRFRIQNG